MSTGNNAVPASGVSTPASQETTTVTPKPKVNKPAAQVKKHAQAPVAPQAKSPEPKGPADVNLGQNTFENAKADNPLASQKKTLTEKIQEHAEKVQAERAKSAGKQVKKTVVVNPVDERTPDQIKAASATAGAKPKESMPAVADEGDLDPGNQPVSVVQQALDDANDLSTQDPDSSVEALDTPPWEPNYKIKSKKLDPNMKDGVADIESEIPESFRALMKDPESEKQVRELFEKSSSVDYIKETRLRVQEQRDHATNYIEQMHGRLQQVEQQIGQGDLDSAFQTMAIPEEKVLQWVLNKINYSQLEPGQRQLIDAQRASEARAKTLEQQNQQLFQGQMKAMVSAKGMALDAILQRPDISQVISAYDTREGRKPTDPSFRDLVINHGELSWHRSGGKADLSPHEAVEAVLRDYGIAQSYGSAGTKPQAQAQVRQPQAAPTQGQTPQQTRQTQALPRVEGRSVSPAKAKITKMSHLLEYRKKALGM